MILWGWLVDATGLIVDVGKLILSTSELSELVYRCRRSEIATIR